MDTLTPVDAAPVRRPRKTKPVDAPPPAPPPVGAKAIRNASPLLSFYGMARETLGSVATTGWRNVFCWGAILIVLSAYWRALNGQEVNLEAFRSLADLVLVTFIYRGAIDKGGLADLTRAAGEAIGRARRAPPGGAVAAG